MLPADLTARLMLEDVRVVRMGVWLNSHPNGKHAYYMVDRQGFSIGCGGLVHFKSIDRLVFVLDQHYSGSNTPARDRRMT